MHGDVPIIPLEVQLEAICLRELSQAHIVLGSFVPHLRGWDAQSESFETYKARIRRYLTLTPKDLIAYLQEHPETSRSLLQASYDKRSSPSTFVEEWQNGQYRVGWVDTRKKPVVTQIRVFPTLAEAVADYVLFSWGLPRLSREHSAWYEMDRF